MKLFGRKLCAVLVLSAILSLSLTSLPSGYSAGENVPQDVLVFLKDVMKLDLAKYILNPYEPSLRYRDDLGGLPENAGVIDLYSLTAPTSQLKIAYSFINNTLDSMLVYVLQGSPLCSQPLSTNQTEVVDGFLESYQSFTGDAEISAMRSMVSSVDLTKNSSVTYGNIWQKVTIDIERSSFRWSYTFNGAVYSSLSVVFKNGFLDSLLDDRSYVKVGGTDVNVSKDEAVSTALEQVKNYSYTFQGERIKDFVILQDLIGAALLTKARDEPLVFYPYWIVSLPLDKEYPGFINWIEVSMWADTGEIISVSAMGRGGGPPPPSDEQQSGSFPITWIAVALAIIIVAAATASVYIIRKRKK